MQKPDLGPGLPGPDTVGTWASTPVSILLPAFLPSTCLFPKTTQTKIFYIICLLPPELVSTITFQQSCRFREAPTPVSSISSHSMGDVPYSSNCQSTKQGKTCVCLILSTLGDPGWLEGPGSPTGTAAPCRDLPAAARSMCPRPRRRAGSLPRERGAESDSKGTALFLSQCTSKKLIWGWDFHDLAGARHLTRVKCWRL